MEFYKFNMTKTIQQLFDLTGKTAIVTGGSRGLGKEMAEGLAEAGASVMLCARREEWLTETLDEFRGRGFNAEGKTCDVSNAEDVQAVVDETINKFGKVDILINNAGISWGAMPEDMPLEKWQKVLDVNLTGCFLMAQAVGREMLKNNSGSIINIASIAGIDFERERSVLFGICGEQSRSDRFDERIGGKLGTQRNPRQRHRARIFSFPFSRCRD